MEGLKTLSNLYTDAHNNKAHEFHDLSIFKETYEEFYPIIHELLEKNYTSPILEKFQNEKKQAINNFSYNLFLQTPLSKAIAELLKKQLQN